MSDNSMIKDKYQNHPKFKANSASRRWSRLFLYDQLLGKTANTIDDTFKATFKKVHGDTKIGKKFLDLHLQNVDHLVEQNKSYDFTEPFEITSVQFEDFNKEDFKKWKSKVGKPLVIRDFLKNADILEMMSNEKLIENFGDQDIKCMKVIREKGKEKLSNVGQNVTTESTSLKNFLLSDAFKGYYVNNFYGIVDDQSFLQACKGTVLNEYMQKDCAFFQWFVSRPEAASGSTLHCAPADNMFLNVRGRKEWYFIDPSYTPVMQPAMSKYGAYCVSELEEELEGDFFTDFVHRHEEMKKVPIYHTVLNEGDILFNPPWWWHRVKNLSEVNIGCATRYVDEVKSIVNAPTLYGGMLIESMKNPKKSIIGLTLKATKNKKHAAKVIESVFSKNKNP